MNKQGKIMHWQVGLISLFCSMIFSSLLFAASSEGTADSEKDAAHQARLQAEYERAIETAGGDA